MTQRICFQLQVRPDRAAAYAEAHAAVWPEMREALGAAGWHNYSLFLAAEGTVIGYVECEDFGAALTAMAATAVNARWQQAMDEYFVGLDGQRPDEGITPIPEIFHLD